ncbi:MAG: hypothetical protein ACREI8_13910, partial [Myxococcota bacterium]
EPPSARGFPAPAAPTAPPPGTTQLLVSLAEPEPTPAFEAGHGVEPDLLAEPAEGALDGAMQADFLFEPSFQEATQATDSAAEAPAAPAAALFAIKGLGAPALVDSRTLAVPVQIRDAAGRLHGLTLRLRIEAIEDESS